jgi:hypothetical protein
MTRWHICALTAAMLLLTPRSGPVFAHQAPGGWHYDSDCCSSHDCAPVADTAIREVAGGYFVLLHHGEHHMLAEGYAIADMVPFADPRLRVSGDGQKHACISRSGRLLCIYVPPGGV